MYAESDISEEFSLNIPLIHIVYDRNEERLANLSQLVKVQPDIVSRIPEVSESEMVRMLIFS